jgi:SPP1 family predicted phage head-tail adaptor
MRQRVVVYQPVETVDEYGHPIVTWDVWEENEPAEFTPTGGVETVSGRQIEATVKGIFLVHYRPGYTTQMKVNHNGIDYGILYINPVEGGRRYLELMCAASGTIRTGGENQE